VDGVTIVASAGALHQVAHQRALAEGLAAHGVPVALTYITHRVQTERVACWGWRQGRVLHAEGHSVLVMERGYIGDRMGTWSSLAWNGLNGRGNVAAIPDDGGDRFNEHHAGLLKPWNPDGEYVLIAGQVPGDAAIAGCDMPGWYAAQAAKPWGLPVRFRPHPLAHRKGPIKPVPGAQVMNGDLAIALEGAAWVVTYNSNTAVDSYLAGKPTHVDDEGSMAWNVTNREQWAHRLAWRQWRMDEIESGFALEHVGVSDGR
jgi:hypothetical protein